MPRNLGVARSEDMVPKVKKESRCRRSETTPERLLGNRRGKGDEGAYKVREESFKFALPCSI